MKAPMNGVTFMQLEEPDLICAQAFKAMAETTKAEAETKKIEAETTKILQEHRYYPKVTIGAFLVGAVGAAVAIIKLRRQG
jgi:hypothetical protein